MKELDITKIFINMLAQKALNIGGLENLFDVNYVISYCDNGFDFSFCLAYEFILKFSKSKNFVKMDELAQKEVIDWLVANKCEYNNQIETYKEELYNN